MTVQEAYEAGKTMVDEVVSLWLPARHLSSESITTSVCVPVNSKPHLSPDESMYMHTSGNVVTIGSVDAKYPVCAMVNIGSTMTSGAVLGDSVVTQNYTSQVVSGTSAVQGSPLLTLTKALQVTNATPSATNALETGAALPSGNLTNTEAVLYTRAGNAIFSEFTS